MIETSCAETKGICRLKKLVRQAIASIQGNMSCSPGLMIAQISNQFGVYHWGIFIFSSYCVKGFFRTLRMELAGLFSTYRSKSTYIHRLCMSKHAGKIQKLFRWRWILVRYYPRLFKHRIS